MQYGVSHQHLFLSVPSFIYLRRRAAKKPGKLGIIRSVRIAAFGSDATRVLLRRENPLLPEAQRRVRHRHAFKICSFLVCRSMICDRVWSDRNLNSTFPLRFVMSGDACVKCNVQLDSIMASPNE